MNWVISRRDNEAAPSLAKLANAADGIQLVGGTARRIMVQADEAAVNTFLASLGSEFTMEPEVMHTQIAQSTSSDLASLLDRSTRKSPYFLKDRAKAAQATQMIGQGSPRSSTAAYANACAPMANTGMYDAADTVFVSAEGARAGRFAAIRNGKPQGAYENLEAAAMAGASFVVDKPGDRERSYNVGEREVEGFLLSMGYTETSPGIFTKHER